MLAQTHPRQTVPVILLLLLILMLLLQILQMMDMEVHLQVLLIAMEYLLQIVITRRTYYPSITMVFITTVVQPHQVTMVPAIQLLLLIPMVLLLMILMVLLVTHPPPVMLQQLLAMQGLLRRHQLQGQDLSLVVTKILRLTSCPSISSLRSPLV